MTTIPKTRRGLAEMLDPNLYVTDEPDDVC